MVKNQKHISPLGTKLYFYVNFSRKISIVLTPNMAALSRGCKPRIVSMLMLTELPEIVTVFGRFF